jgi:putative transposase
MDLITPIDRGIARPVQTHDKTYTLEDKVLAKQKLRERYIKRYQRKLARQTKGSNQSKKTKKRIALAHAKTANVRTDFLHKTSRAIVDGAKVVVMENLKLKNMSKRAKPVFCEKTQKWLRNNAAAKSGLNKALLGVGLYKLEEFINYKAYKQNKVVFKINPMNTSRECAVCGYTHSDNRQTQSIFRCQQCGHTDNADHNAAMVIRKRAIDLLHHSGTELVGTRKNVLRLRANGKSCKTLEAKATNAEICSSKKIAAKAA